MKNYTAELLHREDYSVTNWSGGTTTELAIAPRGSIYAERNFLWRLSSATVDVEESNFTALPDYNRIIMTLQGGIRLRHNGGEWISLPEFETHDFDGGDETVSVGKVVDFNLMLRKGKCEGFVLPLLLKEGEAAALSEQLMKAIPEAEELLLHCPRGVVEIAASDGASWRLSAGDTLRLSGELQGQSFTAKAEEAAALVGSAVRSAG